MFRQIKLVPSSTTGRRQEAEQHIHPRLGAERPAELLRLTYGPDQRQITPFRVVAVQHGAEQAAEAVQRGEVQVIVGQSRAHRQVAQEVYARISKQFDQLIVFYQLGTYE